MFFVTLREDIQSQYLSGTYNLTDYHANVVTLLFTFLQSLLCITLG